MSLSAKFEPDTEFRTFLKSKARDISDDWLDERITMIVPDHVARDLAEQKQAQARSMQQQAQQISLRLEMLQVMSRIAASLAQRHPRLHCGSPNETLEADAKAVAAAARAVADAVMAECGFVRGPMP